jgi:hypothetical protein
VPLRATPRKRHADAAALAPPLNGCGRARLLVIDGREIDWNEFGRMLMSFEESQSKLNIADKSKLI